MHTTMFKVNVCLCANMKDLKNNKNTMNLKLHQPSTRTDFYPLIHSKLMIYLYEIKGSTKNYLHTAAAPCSKLPLKQL